MYTQKTSRRETLDNDSFNALHYKHTSIRARGAVEVSVSPPNPQEAELLFSVVWSIETPH